MPGVPEAEQAPIVAHAEGRSSDRGCPEGLLRADHRVHEVGPEGRPDELVLVTEFDVITGESNCTSNWGHTGIAARHDWGAGEFDASGTVTAPRSEFVPAESGRGRATLETAHTDRVGDWRVHLTPPTKSTSTYHFVSQFSDPGPLDDGDTLVHTRGEAAVRNGWLGGSGELGVTSALVYGDDDR